MVEKRNFVLKKIIKLVLVLFSLLFLFSSTYFIFRILNFAKRKVLVPENFELNYAHIYSADLKNQLNDFIFNDLKLKNNYEIEPEKICTSIKKEFDFVCDVVWDFSYPKIAKLKIIGTRPTCKLNQKLVLARNDRLFDFNYFKDIDCKELYNFNLSNDVFNDDSFSHVCSFVQNIPQKIWQDYEPYYFSYSAVFLRQINSEFVFNLKKIVPFYLVTKKDCLKNNEILHVDDLVNFVNQDVKRKSNYLFDLRFRRRVYARPMLKKELEEIQNIGRV